MKLLFVCNMNMHRSKTAEEVFRNSFETISAGLFNGNPLTRDQLSWADIVFVMDDEQSREIAKRFPKLYVEKRILSLDVPEHYRYNEPELIKLLKSKVKAALESTCSSSSKSN